MDQCYKCRAEISSVYCGKCGTQVRCNVEDCNELFKGVHSQKAHMLDCHPDVASSTDLTVGSLSQKAVMGASKAFDLVKRATVVVTETAGANDPGIKEGLISLAKVSAVVIVLIALSVLLVSRSTDPYRGFYGTWQLVAFNFDRTVSREDALKSDSTITIRPDGKLLTHEKIGDNTYDWRPTAVPGQISFNQQTEIINCSLSPDGKTMILSVRGIDALTFERK